MMKQLLRQAKAPPPPKKEQVLQQEDQEVRKEELYLPKATQDEVEKSFQHGIGNPATGGLKCVPVSRKEVADSKGEAMLEWIARNN
eukprot:7706325-Prorocentrum_lima.AAC.1